jgi:hypothetical protein
MMAFFHRKQQRQLTSIDAEMKTKFRAPVDQLISEIEDDNDRQRKILEVSVYTSANEILHGCQSVLALDPLHGTIPSARVLVLRLSSLRVFTRCHKFRFDSSHFLFPTSVDTD